MEKKNILLNISEAEKTPLVCLLLEIIEMQAHEIVILKNRIELLEEELRRLRGFLENQKLNLIQLLNPKFC